MLKSFLLLLSLLHLPSPQAAKSLEKCSTCRQRLADVRHYSPGEGAGAEQVIAHPTVNICMDADDDQALQYKLTDFAVYDKVSDTEQHLVPIFAESLLSRYKKLYLAGKVLRLDSEEGEEGLKVRSHPESVLLLNAVILLHLLPDCLS